MQIQEDTEERILETRLLLEVFFRKEKELKFIFDKMSYTHRKEYIDWLTGAKKRRYITE
ncbi:MAG: YdeI/OmpD-associated family protein [Sphingobacteriales bacterium]|nr:YdeI/OmpD-associated family protein [Sphingobacteriales bacterium]